MFKALSKKPIQSTTNNSGQENNSAVASTAAIRPTLQQLVVDLSMIVVSRQYSTNAKKVKDFFDEVWKDIKSVKGNFTRYDIVGDNYIDLHPLKDSTRESRGPGTVVEKLTVDGRLPKNFGSDYLKSERNKAALYELMANYFLEAFTSEIVVTTGKETLTKSSTINMSGSNHLEADFRIVTHIIDGINNGFTEIVVRAGDTDVLIILAAYMPTFLTLNPKVHIVLAFGNGKSKTDFDMNNIVLQIGLYKCKGLLFLHAISGCDYSSGLYGLGKTRWLEIYLSDKSELTHIAEIFKELSSSPSEITSEHEQAVTKFILLLYRCTPTLPLAEARLDYLNHTHQETLRSVPPSPAALLQHIKRAAYISGYLWGKAEQASPTLPDIEQWGWSFSGEDVLAPVWTLKRSDNVFKILVKSCGCGEQGKMCMRETCSCKRRKCLPFCKCRGDCEKDNPTPEQIHLVTVEDSQQEQPPSAKRARGPRHRR